MWGGGSSLERRAKRGQMALNTVVQIGSSQALLQHQLCHTVVQKHHRKTTVIFLHFFSAFSFCVFNTLTWLCFYLF